MSRLPTFYVSAAIVGVVDRRILFCVSVNLLATKGEAVATGRRVYRQLQDADSVLAHVSFFISRAEVFVLLDREVLHLPLVILPKHLLLLSESTFSEVA